MVIKETHRMTTPTRVLDLAPGADPEDFAKGEPYELLPMVRLFADEGKLLERDGARQTCVIAESAEGWTEVDANTAEPEADARR